MKQKDMSVQDRAILLDDDTVVGYDKMLITTGATPRTLPFMTEELRGKISTYRTVRIHLKRCKSFLLKKFFFFLL